MVAAAQAAPNGYVDVDRICDLPFSEPMQHRCEAWDEVPHLALCPEHHMAACPGTDADTWSYVHLQAPAYDAGFRLWEVQCRAMRDWTEQGGLLAPIGVGWGKTLVTQYIANHDWRDAISDRVLLLVPSSVYDQTMRHAMPFARTHIEFNVPVVGMGGISPARRRGLVHAARPGLYVMPHSLLSTADTEDILGELDPGTVVVDECHQLVNLSAARAQRFNRFLRARERRCAFLSGTITKKSVREYAPQLAFALKNGSPLPTSQRMAMDWAAVLDSDAPSRVVSTGPLAPLRDWARTHFPEQDITEDQAGTRRAYKLRLNATPGCVATGDADIGTGLVIKNVPCEIPPSEELNALLLQLEQDGLTPNGDEIEYPIHLYKWRYELITTGGYNERIWPEPEAVAKKWNVDLEEAAYRIALAQDAHEKHNEYARELRHFIEDTHAARLDTPMLVGAHFKRHLLVGTPLQTPSDLLGLWMTAKEAKEAATDKYGRIVERDERFVRVDNSRASHAAELALELHKQSKRQKDNGSVIVWAYHTGFAEWIYDYLAGLTPEALYCPAGGENNEAVHAAQFEGKVVVASISGHGEGKNLHEYGQTLFAQTPRQANVFEQALGRNHRGGQTRDELVMHVMLSSPFEHMCYAAMLIDALYVQQTTGARQKAVCAVYDPMPKVTPGAVLRERGIPDARLLDGGMQKDLNDRFEVTP